MTDDNLLGKVAQLLGEPGPRPLARPNGQFSVSPLGRGPRRPPEALGAQRN